MGRKKNNNLPPVIIIWGNEEKTTNNNNKSSNIKESINLSNTIEARARLNETGCALLNK